MYPMLPTLTPEQYAQLQQQIQSGSGIGINDPNPYADPNSPLYGQTPTGIPIPDRLGTQTSQIQPGYPQTTTATSGDWFTQNAPTSTSSTNATAPLLGQSSSTGNLGGGWDQYAAPGTPQGALQQAFQQGLTGQAAVDFANQQLGLQPPHSISYGADGSYGLPNGFYVAPNAQKGGQLDLIARGSGGGGGGGFGSLDFGYTPFSPPTLADARNSPGYQFALEQGMKAIQNSAAAKGTLLTGGTLKALQGYGTGLADQTYGNDFERALQASQTRFGQGLQANQANYGNLYNLAALGLRGATA